MDTHMDRTNYRDTIDYCIKKFLIFTPPLYIEISILCFVFCFKFSLNKVSTMIVLQCRQSVNLFLPLVAKRFSLRGKTIHLHFRCRHSHLFGTNLWLVAHLPIDLTWITIQKNFKIVERRARIKRIKKPIHTWKLI